MSVRFVQAIITALAFLLIMPQAARADNTIQLLPPTYYGTGNPCVSASPNNQVLFLGGTGQNGQSAINCLTNGNSFVVNPTNGFVGIGNAAPQTSLDVAGPVRPVDTATACSAAIGGSLRYNSGTNIFEGCVNVSGNWQWKPFGTPSCGEPSYIVNDPNNPGTQCISVCPAGLLHGNFPNAQEFRVVVPNDATSIGQVETTYSEDDGSPTYVVTCTWQGWSMGSPPTGP
jgi:hypothetical protein